MEVHLLGVADENRDPPPGGVAVGDGDGARCPPVEEGDGLQGGEAVGFFVMVEDGGGTLVVGGRSVVGD